MTIASILMALTITIFLTGCSGLKLHPAAAETAAPAPETVEPPPQIQSAPPTPIDIQPKLILAATPLEVPAADERCLALNIYYEAGIEAEIGKIAIAHVTINRLHTGRWGDSLCDVVYADAQFSWTGISKLRQPSGTSWHASRKAAHQAIDGLRVDSLKKALYYHATYVKPYWRRFMKKIQRIGQHVFYAEARTAQATLPNDVDPICSLLLPSGAVGFDTCAEAALPSGP
jgi:hypothetical protein